MKSIVINGEKITIKAIDFAAICDLEELGLEVTSVGKKLFSAIRTAYAYHSEKTLEEASVDIEAHIKNGGTINDLRPFLEAITESDFFKALLQKEKKAD